MIKSSFKERIQELMAYYSLSQSDICKKAKISKSAMSQYLSGYRTPRQDKIDLISLSYGVNPAWLVGYDFGMFEGTNKSNEHSDLMKKINSLSENNKRLVFELIEALSNKKP